MSKPDANFVIRDPLTAPDSAAVGVNLAALVVDMAGAEADNEPNHRLRTTVDCEGMI